MTRLKSMMTAALVAASVSISATAATAKDIVDTAVSAGNFSTLVAAVQAAGLVDTLKGEGPFTVFAPTDAAFAKLPEGTVENLLKPENRDKLVSILTYHVVSGKVMSGDIAGKEMMVDSVQGAKIDVDARQGVKVNDANVVTADVAASNGVIHVIDSVILPPEG
ncbi:MAG: fasciclin domain-containing protein [Acetobacterales bacterium]